VLIYDELPSDPEEPPDRVLGAPDFYTNAFVERNGVRSVWSVCSTGKELVIASVDGRVVIHQDLPTVSNEDADHILGLRSFGRAWRSGHYYDPMGEFWAIWSDGLRLVVLDRTVNAVHVWRRIPAVDLAYPDLSVSLQGVATNPKGLTIAGERLFVSDPDANRILVWNTLPTGAAAPAPDLILGSVPEPFHLSTDGTRLAVGAPEKGIYIWNQLPTVADQPPDVILKGTDPQLNLPHTPFLFDGRLFVTDNGNHRVCVYNSVPITDDQRPDVVLGQPNLESRWPGMTYTKLHNPTGLWFDGEYLWVSEFKFADRVLRFKANIAPTAPASPSGLVAQVISGNQVRLTWQDDAANERGQTVWYRRLASSEATDAGTPDLAAWGHVRAGATSCIVDGLVPASSYEFAVSAANSHGESPMSLPVLASTLDLANHPPAVPSAPDPDSGYPDVPDDMMWLNWHGGDADPGDVVTYALYLGNTPSPPLYATTNSPHYLRDAPWAAGTTYYWRVTATDSSGATAEGPLWTFAVGWPGNLRSLAVSADPGGNTNPTPATYFYQRMSFPMAQAVPHPGQRFTGWSGAVDAGHALDNPVSLLLDKDKSIMAHFAGITVLTPNGGEVWEVGGARTIAWTSSDTSGDVEIEYSTDGGVQWNAVAAATANDGSFEWIVPDTPSSQCVMRVSEASAGFPWDTSDAPFSIVAQPTPPAIELDRSELHFVCFFGGPLTDTEVVNVSNAGASVLNWQATTSGPWITVDPESGTGGGPVVVTVSGAGFMAGDYVGSVSFADPAATNSPQVIAVTLRVSPVRPPRRIMRGGSPQPPT